MKRLANYKMDGLMHLRILLVDQHVEGNELSAMEWVLRADVERTALLEDEARLLAVIHREDDKPVPADLKGVNLEVALQECYERMDAIGVNSSEMRATKILEGLGFEQSMMTMPTNGLSGGWAMRAALAAALFVKPNLLLLDEVRLQYVCTGNCYFNCVAYQSFGSSCLGVVRKLAGQSVPRHLRDSVARPGLFECCVH